MKAIKIALAGNPNCGKTTVFNNLTGARQHVGNYPGVTVERKEGHKRFAGIDMLFLDLPGTYSLTARSLDEVVARNTIINERPDVIVNVQDASNLERNLYLTAQLVELGQPVVIALNMVDVADQMGIHIDLRKLSDALGITVVQTVGSRNVGTVALLEDVARVAKEGKAPQIKIDYGPTLEHLITTMTTAIQAQTDIQYPIRWLAIKLLENDQEVQEALQQRGGMEDVLNLAHCLRNSLPKEIDAEFIFAEKRHQFAVQIFQQAVTVDPTLHETRSDKIDKVLTHRFFGPLIFAGMMWLLFNAVFTLGAYPQEWLDGVITDFGTWLTTVLPEGAIQSLVVDGIVGGVGAVLSFLPLILILFAGIALLEDSGYMARAAFILDRMMHAVGLHGKSFIMLLLGFGCTVPAVMGTRSLDNPRDRMVTMLVAPMMSCGARLPVYTLLIGAFFTAKWAGTVLFGIYMLGIVLAIVLALAFRKFLFPGEREPFVMEMPEYHVPTLKGVLLHMWERAELYFKKAGTFILAASVVVWFITVYPQNVPLDQDYDALRAAATQEYQTQAEAVLAPFAINEINENPALFQAVATLETLQTQNEEALAAAQEEGNAAEEETLAKSFTAYGREFPVALQSVAETQPQYYPYALEYFALTKDHEEEMAAIDRAESADQLAHSYAGQFGHMIEPVLQPLGFNWKIGVSLVAALTAKEVLVSSLGTIYSMQADPDDSSGLMERLAADPAFDPLIALSLMVFVLLYCPCLAVLAVMRRETDSFRWPAFVFMYCTSLAWVCSFVVYQGGRMLGF